MISYYFKPPGNIETAFQSLVPLNITYYSLGIYVYCFLPVALDDRAMNKKTLEEVSLDLAMNLKAIRAEKGLAQQRLASDAGVDRTVVSKIERAKTNPSLDVLLRLANQLDTTLAHLLKANKPL